VKYLLEAAPAACSLPTRAYYLLTTMASSRRPVPRLPNERYLHKLSPVCLVLTLPTTAHPGGRGGSGGRRPGPVAPRRALALSEGVEASRPRRIAGGGVRTRSSTARASACQLQCSQLESRDVGSREPSEVARVRKSYRRPAVTEPERETSVATRHSTPATSRSTCGDAPAYQVRICGHV
jgi:hypothetical protein